MELIHVETYEEARQEVQRLKGMAGNDVPVPIYRIVDSPYSGFDIVVVDSDFYADMLSDELIDGFPPFPGLNKVRLRARMK